MSPQIHHIFIFISRSLASAQIVTSISKTDEGDITLYAVWESRTYNITYISKGSTVHTETYTCGIEKKIDYFLSDTNEEVFEGWYTAENGGSQFYMISDTDYGNKTVYAHWKTKAITYTVTFAGTGTSYTITVGERPGYTAPDIPNDPDGEYCWDCTFDYGEDDEHEGEIMLSPREEISPSCDRYAELGVTSFYFTKMA